MKKKLIEILETLNYPIYLQGTLSENEAYPDSFITFWNFENPETSHYDNEPTSCKWGFLIYFYSTNPALVESELLKIKSLLKENGFALTGKPHDVASDEPTHTGGALTCYILETY